MMEGIVKQRKYLRHHHLSRIFLKNLSLLTIIIIFPTMLMIGICYISFENFLESEINNYSSKSIKVIQNNTNEMINECLTQMNSLIADLDVSVFMQTGKDEPIFYDHKVIYKQIKIQMNIRDFLSSIYIYSEKSGVVISNMGVVQPTNLYDTKWLDSYQINKDNCYFWYEIRNQSSSPILPKQLLSLYKTVNYGKNNTGVIVYNIDFQRFITQLNRLRNQYDEALCIVTENNSLVVNLWGNPEKYLTPENLQSFHNGKNYINTGTDILYRIPIDHTTWQFVSSVPLSMYESNLSSLRTIIIWIVAVGLTVTFIITFLISLRIYRPFRNIMGALHQPMHYVGKKDDFTKDEEGYIISAIRNTLSKNESISKELEERVQLLKKAQTLALQAQINPHFLYNTLDAINWMAMRLTGGKNDASAMISKLADMLRYSLENSDTLVALKSELNSVRTYLELQELRYKNQFLVEWDIDEAATSCSVMKLILQPIVENSIYHGIKLLFSVGVISISAKIDLEHLVLTVTDNGLGMNHRTLDRLNSAMQNASIKEEEHIGILNVNQRIRLFFGEEYGVKVYSKEGMGTQVVLTLPLNRQNDLI